MTSQEWMEGDDARGREEKQLSWKSERVSEKLEYKLALYLELTRSPEGRMLVCRGKICVSLAYIA